MFQFPSGFQFLVTTNADRIPQDRPIVMLDGTVPGWSPRPRDIHYDHHRPGGADIQLDEIAIAADPRLSVATFVTTQVDADACAAAAWFWFCNQPASATFNLFAAYEKLRAIAYDCDHLGLPADSEWDHLRDFAKKAVAALKESGNALVQELGLSANRKEWTEADKERYASLAFQRGTEWLIAASMGECPYPGEQGEADAYFARMEAMRDRVYANCWEFLEVAVFDQRGFDEYVDPRLLVEWARQESTQTLITRTIRITLTIRDGSCLPNAAALKGTECFSYTLGSVPLNPKGSPKFSDRGIWEALAILERNVRMNANLPLPATTWGGRNEVGGSGWRDPAISGPTAIIRLLNALLIL